MDGRGTGFDDVWLAVRRPLLVALVLGCAMSLMTSARLTLRLVIPATVYWSCVPAFEIAALAVICLKSPHPRVIDEFFRGHAPWLLWMTAFAAQWAFVPPATVFGKTAYPLIWYGLALIAALWSARLDFAFSRRVLGRTRVAAARDVVVQRAICWTGFLAIFVGSSVLQVVASRLGL